MQYNYVAYKAGYSSRFIIERYFMSTDSVVDLYAAIKIFFTEQQNPLTQKRIIVKRKNDDIHKTDIYRAPFTFLQKRISEF